MIQKYENLITNNNFLKISVLIICKYLLKGSKH